MATGCVWSAFTKRKQVIPNICNNIPWNAWKVYRLKWYFTPSKSWIWWRTAQYTVPGMLTITPHPQSSEPWPTTTQSVRMRKSHNIGMLCDGNVSEAGKKRRLVMKPQMWRMLSGSRYCGTVRVPPTSLDTVEHSTPIHSPNLNIRIDKRGRNFNGREKIQRLLAHLRPGCVLLQ